MTFTIKKNKDEILSTLIHFKKEVFDKSISDEHFIALADKFAQYGVFVVASEGISDVGYVAFYCNDFETKTAFISMIIVGYKFQSNGYGRKLLGKALQIARKSGMNVVKLEVNQANRNALNFYYRAGFVLSSRLKTSFILEKPIKEEIQ